VEGEGGGFGGKEWGKMHFGERRVTRESFFLSLLPPRKGST
jgi:hypothetical protein